MMLHGIMLIELCIHWSQVVLILLANISISLISRRSKGERERENDVDVEVDVDASCWITFLLGIPLSGTLAYIWRKILVSLHPVVFFDTIVTTAEAASTTTVTIYILCMLPRVCVTTDRVLDWILDLLATYKS
jgi:hypothetical protein